MELSFKTALIIGASRGLGRELVQQLASKGVAVTGTVRDAKLMSELQATPLKNASWQLLDIDNEQNVTTFLSNLAHPHYDLIFINAGVKGPEHQSVISATEIEIGKLFQTNAVSPVSLARKLTPWVREDSGVIAFMTSVLGSIELAEGYWELYSASKAALNSLTRAYAKTLLNRSLTVLSIHPGWVKTDMGGEDAQLSVETSVDGIVKTVIANIGHGGHQYLDYEGKSLPW